MASAHAQPLTTVRKQGCHRGVHDLIFATTALSSRRSLVTTDETAFADFGVDTTSYRKHAPHRVRQVASTRKLSYRVGATAERASSFKPIVRSP